MTANVRNIYVNDNSIQTHTRKNRVRAWSESTTTSLLSSSDSLTSIRAGGGPAISVSAARRPLPEIPAAQSPLIHAQLELVRTTSVHRTGSSKRDRRKRAGSESRRNTLIYLSIASAVFSLVCLSLLAATFFRHGILPWDDVVAGSSSQGSCHSCVGLLQAALQCQTVNDNMMPSSSTIDESATSQRSERISSNPSSCTCQLMQHLHQLNPNNWNIRTGTGDVTVPDSGQYVIFSRSEVQMGPENCRSEMDSEIFKFKIYRRRVDGNIFSVAQNQFKTCQLINNDKSGIYCLADVVNLDKGDIIYTTLTVNGVEIHPVDKSRHLQIVQLS